MPGSSVNTYSAKFCGDSVFEDQTSGVSPSIKDCEQPVHDLETSMPRKGWVGVTPLEKQPELTSSGSCKFGVIGKGIPGNFDV